MLVDRTAVHIKDKWRVLKKKDLKEEEREGGKGGGGERGREEEGGRGRGEEGKREKEGRERQRGESNCLTLYILENCGLFERRFVFLSLIRPFPLT